MPHPYTKLINHSTISGLWCEKKRLFPVSSSSIWCIFSAVSSKSKIHFILWIDNMKWPHICSNVDLLYCNKNEQSKTEFPQLLLLVPFIIIQILIKSNYFLRNLICSDRNLSASLTRKVHRSTHNSISQMME